MPYWQGMLDWRSLLLVHGSFLAHRIWILCIFFFFLSVQFKNEKSKHIWSREKSVVMRAHHAIWRTVKGTRDFEEEEVLDLQIAT